jgi:CheY-like chemotaxis protein
VRVLIVDDEPTIRQFFTQMARNQGFDTVHSVDSAKAALSSVLRQSYDLITLDILMPGLSGLEIIAMLRNMNPHAVIAVISGFIPEQVPEEVQSCIDVLLPKPISVETFSELLGIASSISQWLQQLHSLGVRSEVVAR